MDISEMAEARIRELVERRKVEEAESDVSPDLPYEGDDYNDTYNAGFIDGGIYALRRLLGELEED